VGGAVALDPTAQVAPDAAALLIDTLGPLAERIGKPQGKAFRLHVQSSAPTRSLVLRVGDAIELTDWDGGSNDGVLRIPAEAFLRLLYGRLDPAHTPAIELTAPIALDDLRHVFPGV
jgi:MDMPI C-terminal domain